MQSFESVGLPASVMSQLDEMPDRDAYPEMLRFRSWVTSFRSYLIWDPKVLRNPDRGKHGVLGPSGEHLAAMIGQLKDKRPDAFHRLVRRVRGLFPTVKDISVSGRGWGWRGLRLHEGNGRDVVFNSQQMSDGVLRLLAITTLLYADRVPGVLTLEEPENGVHPQLVREAILAAGALRLRQCAALPAEKGRRKPVKSSPDGLEVPAKARLSVRVGQRFSRLVQGAQT